MFGLRIEYFQGLATEDQARIERKRAAPASRILFKSICNDARENTRHLLDRDATSTTQIWNEFAAPFCALLLSIMQSRIRTMAKIVPHRFTRASQSSSSTPRATQNPSNRMLHPYANTQAIRHPKININPIHKPAEDNFSKLNNPPSNDTTSGNAPSRRGHQTSSVHTGADPPLKVYDRRPTTYL